jgi:hypothetical protein
LCLKLIIDLLNQNLKRCPYRVFLQLFSDNSDTLLVKKNSDLKSEQNWVASYILSANYSIKVPDHEN